MRVLTTHRLVLRGNLAAFVALCCLSIAGCGKAPTTQSNDAAETAPDEVVVEFADDAGPAGEEMSEQEPNAVEDDDEGEQDEFDKDGEGDAVEDDEQDEAPSADAALNTTHKADVVLGSAELFTGIPGEGTLTTEQIASWLDNPANHQPLPINLPLGLAAAAATVKGVDENPITRAKIELGRQLYFDTRLSADNTVSCASCHHPEDGFARDTTFGEGIEGQTGDRNSPVCFNRIFSDAQFWDGRAASVEEQAKGPIENPIEMGNTHENAVLTVMGIDGYALQFAKIFPEEGVTIDTIAKAIATFERAIVTGPAPYDYLELVQNLENQLDEEEIEELEEDDPELYMQYKMAKDQVADLPAAVVRGRDLFFSEKANCTACHAGANFADEQYHNIGVGMDQEEPDVGRFKVTGEEKDKGAFKTPTVRSASMTGPYMHDGSQKTLMEVIEWYDKGGHANPHLSDKMKKLGLTEEEKQDLLAFMEQGLLGPFPPMEMERLAQ